MPNEVKVVFIGDPSPLFGVADKVEARMGNIGANTLNDPFKKITTSIIEATPKISAFVNSTATAVNRAETALDRLAAKSRDFANQFRQADPFASSFNVPAGQVGGLLNRYNIGEAERAAAAREQSTRQALVELRQRLDAERIEFARDHRTNLDLRPGPDAFPGTANTNASNQSRIRGLGTGLGQIGNATGITGLGALGAGSVALGGLAIAEIIRLGKDSLEVFEQTNKSTLALRASVEGLGVDYRQVFQDARSFAEKHNQDITTINASYAEFTKLAHRTGADTDSIGQKALDIASKRNLSSDELAAAIKKVNAGIADETLLGAEARTVLDEYAASHGRTADALTETERKQATYNLFLKEGGLAAGDAAAHQTTYTTATTKLANAWQKVNEEIGAYLDRAAHITGGAGGFNYYGIGAGIVGAFFPTTGPATPPASQESKDAQRKAQDENKAALQRALAGANKNAADTEQNLIDFALKNFVDQAIFTGDNIDAAAEAKAKAVEVAKQAIDGFKTSFNNALRRGDLTEISNFQQSLQSTYKNLLPFQEFADLGEKAREAIDKGIKTARSALGDLAGQIEQSNPFVKLFLDADKAAESLQDRIKGLPVEFQLAAVKMQQSLNQTNLFRARVENTFEAFDLRNEAKQLRDGLSPAARQGQLKQQVDDIARANVFAGGSYQSGGTFGSFLANQAGGFDKLSDAQKRNIYEVSLLSNSSPGLNTNSLVSILAKERVQQGQDANLNAQQRLDKNLELLRSFSPRNTEEQSVLDSKAIALSKTFNPDELRQDQKDKLAQAYERQAQRTEQREQTALQTQQRLVTVLDALEKKLLPGVQQASNPAPTEVNINVHDGTSEQKVQNATVANESDVGRTYNLGFFQGTNE